MGEGKEGVAAAGMLAEAGAAAGASVAAAVRVDAGSVAGAALSLSSLLGSLALLSESSAPLYTCTAEARQEGRDAACSLMLYMLHMIMRSRSSRSTYEKRRKSLRNRPQYSTC